MHILTIFIYVLILLHSGLLNNILSANNFTDLVYYLIYVCAYYCRKILQRSGKDHSVLLVLPSGVFRYKFIVDGEVRHVPDLPSETDEMGRVCNLLDVHVS